MPNAFSISIETKDPDTCARLRRLHAKGWRLTRGFGAFETWTWSGDGWPEDITAGDETRVMAQGSIESMKCASLAPSPNPSWNYCRGLTRKGNPK